MDVAEIDAARAAQRLTFDGRNRYPIWSSDGRSVFFQSRSRRLTRNLSAARRRIELRPSGWTTPETGAEHVPHAASSDGSHLLFSSFKDKQWTLSILNLRDRRVTAFGNVRSAERTRGSLLARRQMDRLPDAGAWRSPPGVRAAVSRNLAQSPLLVGVGRPPVLDRQGGRQRSRQFRAGHQSADSVQRQPESGIRRPRTVHADWAHRSQSGHLPAQFRRDAERNAFHRHSHGRV